MNRTSLLEVIGKTLGATVTLQSSGFTKGVFKKGPLVKLDDGLIAATLLAVGAGVTVMV